jgi:hypothetical protein
MKSQISYINNDQYINNNQYINSNQYINNNQYTQPNFFAPKCTKQNCYLTVKWACGLWSPHKR